jgi:hypothetical protein
MLRMQKNIFILVITTVLIGVLSYISYIIYPTIRGPQITLDSPADGEIVEGTQIDVRGSSVNVAKIFMNGTPLNISKEGNFYGKFAIYAGSNILVIEGYDRFGRKVSLERILGTN